MDATTINGTTTNFTLKTTSGGVAVPGTVTYDAATRKATFTPDIRHWLTIRTTPRPVTSGVKDAAGNAMAANDVWTFKTIPDTTPPIVCVHFAADNATGVAISATVTATFSEAMGRDDDQRHHDELHAQDNERRRSGSRYGEL
jgi:hypothetical protein